MTCISYVKYICISHIYDVHFKRKLYDYLMQQI